MSLEEQEAPLLKYEGLQPLNVKLLKTLMQTALNYINTFQHTGKYFEKQCRGE